MTALVEFARMLGLQSRHAEDALHSEQAARLVVSRRGFLGASALLAAGSVFSFAPPGPMSSVQLLVNGNVVRSWSRRERICNWVVPARAKHAADWQQDKIVLRRVGGVGYLDQFIANPRATVVWSAYDFSCEIIA